MWRNVCWGGSGGSGTCTNLGSKGADAACQCLRDILRQAPVGFAVIGPQRRYLLVNEHFSTMHGYGSSREMMDKVHDIRSQVFARPEDYDSLLRRLDEKGTVAGFECRARRRDGSIFWTSRSVRRELDAHSRSLGFVCFVMDIEKFKSMESVALQREEDVRRLSAELLRNTETVRRRLSRELHDGPAQLMAVAKVLLDRMRTASAPDCRDIESVSDLVRRSLEMLRQSIVDLYPPALLSKDMHGMFGHLIQEFREGCGLRLTMSSCEIQDIPLEFKTFFYRAAREFLVNAVKHGLPGEVWVRLLTREGYVVLEVEDDGRGPAAPAAPAQSTSQGLARIRRQAEDLGGWLTLRPAPVKGAVAALALPREVLVPKGGDA